jgi:prephenate dehydratase
MALKGAKVEEHNRGTFHPMALLQCMDFLKKVSSIKLVEDKDTAETAQKSGKTVKRDRGNY